MASSNSDYRFIEKDPIIDIIRGEAQRHGKLTHKLFAEISEKSGVGEGTIRNWFFGDTRRPQHLTIRFVLEALDCKMQVVRNDGTVVRGPRG